MYSTTSAGPTTEKDPKRLRGLQRPQYRLRVEDVRVFYDVSEDGVEVLAIVPKAEAAKWLDRIEEDE